MLPQSTVELYIFIALLSKTPLTPHIPLNLSHGNSRSEFPQFSALSSWGKCLLPLGESHLLFGKKTLVNFWNAIKLWTVFKDLWIQSLVFLGICLCFTSSKHQRSCHQNMPALVTNAFPEYFLEYILTEPTISWPISIVVSLILPLNSQRLLSTPYPQPSPATSTFIFVSDICFHWSASCLLSLLLHCTLFFFILGSFYIQSLKFSFQFRD